LSERREIRSAASPFANDLAVALEEPNTSAIRYAGKVERIMIPHRPRGDLAEPAQDHDPTRRDVWLFAPLLAIAVVLPLAIATVIGVTLWLALRPIPHEASQSAPITFASRWPDLSPSGTLVR